MIILTHSHGAETAIALVSRIMSKCGLIGISLLLTLCCVNSLQKGSGRRGGSVFMTTRGSFAPMHANRAGNDGNCTLTGNVLPISILVRG